MSVLPLLATLRSRDIHIWAEGDRLRCSAPAGVLVPELRHELKEHKHEILAFLRSAEALAQQPRAIVPLQPHGTRPPVFAIAGHNGDVFCYRALVQHLDDNQPFYGLQPPGLDGDGEPLVRVEDLAAYFAAQIRAFRPDGPYIIAGYCAGGSIAFELARQLQQEHAAIRFLALFGCPYPTSYRRLRRLRLRLGEAVKHAMKHARKLASLPFAQRWGYLTQKLRDRKAQRAAERPTASDPVLALRTKVGRATLAALSRYKPGPFAGRVKLFWPCKDWVHSGLEPRRWLSVAQPAEEYFGPDGCNADTMLREPNAAAFAELFRQGRASAAE